MASADRQEGFTFQGYFASRQDRSLLRFPRVLKTAFGVVRAAAPREIVITGLLQIVSGVGVAAQLLIVRALLHDILRDGGPAPFGDMVPELIAMAVTALVVALTGVLVDFYQRVLGEVVALHAQEQVIEAATRVDLLTFYNPDFHDRLARAQTSASQRPVQLVNGVFGIFGTVFAIGGIVITLLIVQPLFGLLVVIAFTPAWLATNRGSRLYYRYNIEQTERQRVRSYLFGLLSRKEEAQEVRAFDLGGFLGQRHRRISQQLIDELRAMLRERLRIALGGQLATVTLTTGALFVVVWFVSSGRMGLASAGSAVAAMVLLTGRLRALSSSAGGLFESSLYLEDYSSFVAVAPEAPGGELRPAAPEHPRVIDASGIAFTYPGRAEPALRDAFLELRRGEVVALVGENGSGKTTFAKILAGLLEAQEGGVRWDGVNSRTFEPASVRQRVAVIFQDFVKYQLSAYDNVALGDHRRTDDLRSVRAAARRGGIDDSLEALPHGYETLLGPHFYGGSDLSGGQWQRVALARAFLREAPIVMLDEPTAALDPRGEAELFAQMRELFAGKSVLLITHRFGSARAADRIYVLRDGAVVEHGGHDELMEQEGYYAELYELQASAYGPRP